eukprot:1299232-Amphidinium_carterae.1
MTIHPSHSASKLAVSKSMLRATAELVKRKAVSRLLQTRERPHPLPRRFDALAKLFGFESVPPEVFVPLMPQTYYHVAAKVFDLLLEYKGVLGEIRSTKSDAPESGLKAVMASDGKRARSGS